MNQGLVAIVFVVGMLAFMGIGTPMAFALVLTGASMAWVLDFWDTQLLAQNLVAGVAQMNTTQTNSGRKSSSRAARPLPKP